MATITDELRAMKIGDSKNFPSHISMTVRSMASMLGFQWDRTYSTTADRKRRIITVKRVK